jgi:predicted metalloprotease with PDZ domain
MRHRRRVGLLLISSLIVGLLFGAHLASVQAADEMPLQNHRAHVLLAFSKPDTDTLTLTFSTYSGSYPIPILGLEATNEKAEKLLVEYTESNGRFWKIMSHNAGQVFVQYVVEFSVMRGGSEHLGYLGNGFAASMAEWTFLMPYQRTVRDVTIQFKMPAGWKSYTPWNNVGQDTYYSNSMQSFPDSVYTLGDFNTFTRRIGATNASIAVYNQWTRETQEQIAQSALKIFEYQSNLFGKSVMDRYIATFFPFADDGVQIWGGENSYSQGISVRTPLDERGFINAMQWFSHQIFHRWNAWIPDGMIRHSSEEQWFSEGVNVYYESKVLLDLGILTEHTVLKEYYRQYLSQYVGTKYDVALTEAPMHTNAEMSGQDAQRYSFIVYEKGALVSLMLDIRIRGLTNGEKTMDNLMSSMYSRYGGMKGQFSNHDVMESLRLLTGHDFTDFFNQYICGTRRLPLDQSFTTTSLAKDAAVWKIGDTVPLTATLTDLSNEPIPNATILFYLNSEHIATRATNSQGIASTTYSANVTGDLTAEAFYPGTDNYTRLQSGDSYTITVKPIQSVTLTTASSTSSLLVFSTTTGSETSRAPNIFTLLPSQTYWLVAIVLVLAILALRPVLRILRRRGS